MTVPLLGILAASVAAVSLAGQSVFVRKGTVRHDSATALVVVLAWNLAVFVPASLLLGSWSFTVEAVVPFLVAGLVGTMGGRALYYESVRRIGASRSEPVKAAQPLHATVFAVLLLGEVVAPGRLVGIAVIVLGLVLVTREQHGDPTSDISLWAFLLPLAAAGLFGLEPAIAKFGLDAGAAVLPALTIKTAAAAVGLLGYLGARGAVPTLGDLRVPGTRWLLAAGAANTLFLCGYYGALSIAPVTFVVPVVQTSPLIVVAVSMRYMGDLERVTWRLVVGAAVIVAGAVTVTLAG